MSVYYRDYFIFSIRKRSADSTMHLFYKLYICYCLAIKFDYAWVCRIVVSKQPTIHNYYSVVVVYLFNNYLTYKILWPSSSNYIINCFFLSGNDCTHSQNDIYLEVLLLFCSKAVDKWRKTVCEFGVLLICYCYHMFAKLFWHYICIILL